MITLILYGTFALIFHDVDYDKSHNYLVTNGDYLIAFRSPEKVALSDLKGIEVSCLPPEEKAAERAVRGSELLRENMYICNAERLVWKRKTKK